ncbi:MAG: polysulfide reductase NrfD [Solirubrobacterales bacterium]|nr:polysulfide reductase NrfD [Solirubrobacterales bacterium]
MSETTSYHGQPVLKEPTWTWEIPMYFFTGGMSGASAGLAYLSELRGNQVLARRAWAISLGAIGISPAFLISDLGKPTRFLNMLRMFKVTSPMSVGSWILSGSGAATSLAALNAWTGLFPRSAKAARPAAALFGLPLSTYTAALIANTAVPVWHEARRTLPFVFGSGAGLSAGAVVAAVTPPAYAAPARRLAIGAALAEGMANELMHHRLGEHGEPYKKGAGSLFSHISRACTVAGAAVMLRRGASSRPAAIAAGALLGAGALSARWSIYKAGFQSAADPKYVVGPQRRAIERGERPGASRSSAKVGEIKPAVGSPASAPVELPA